MDDLPYWPMTNLRLTTPRLELRFPSNLDLAALATVAVGGIHDPAVQPFTAEWTDAPPAQVALSTMQYQWGTWANWKPNDWGLSFVTVHSGQIIGTQEIGAKDFAVLREVHSGSYLGRAFQGRGFGAEMRAAVLHLAFAGLGAQHATSGAFEDNQASLGVSRKLGYREDGIQRCVVRGKASVLRRLRLTREDWEAHRTAPVEIHGLEPCLPLLGAGPNHATLR
ncbi:RimJ/RimL family protein N-acetyltransferase [Catenulispora sp. GP43]|uniref:GNAT family N-acetyltransferase n=1 Tax=Catenulispora sp. GP43 TaxID=3156263 RepID=UPI003511BAFB